jgi:AbiV family abortive infection protein
MDQLIQPIEACFDNARDLLRAAKRVLDDEKLPNVAFHLTILALEEVGKAALLGARGIAHSVDDETVFIDNRLDDHIFKLFWALWTPNFARGNVSKEEFEGLRGMARSMHDDRLAAMYVSPDPSEGDEHLQNVSEERARTMIGLAEARLGMESSRDWQAIDLSAGSVMRWFLDATNDPEKRNLIFGQKSFDKLAEIGQMRDWMAWLKEQFDQAEAQGREYLQHELARAARDQEDRGDDKWQVAIRLYSPAQSIRSRAIKSWNERPTWIKLSAVHNDKQAVEVEFTLREAIPKQELGLMSYRAARLFVAAMNIGSAGFWWWHHLDQTGSFYQRLTDLKAPAGMKLDFSMHLGSKFEWKRDALKEDHLTRVAVCLGMASRLDNPVYYAVIEAYVTALALFAKSDLHLNFGPQACERFAACLLDAMRHFRDWDGTDEGLPAAIAGRFPFNQPDDEQELLALLRQLRCQPLDVTNLTLERAAILKFLCDAYLIRRFETMAASATTGTSTASNAPR